MFLYRDEYIYLKIICVPKRCNANPILWHNTKAKISGTLSLRKKLRYLYQFWIFPILQFQFILIDRNTSSHNNVNNNIKTCFMQGDLINNKRSLIYRYVCLKDDGCVFVYVFILSRQENAFNFRLESNQYILKPYTTITISTCLEKRVFNSAMLMDWKQSE